MDGHHGIMTIGLLAVGIILMPVGFYLMATDGTVVLFAAGTVVVIAALVLSILRSYGFFLDGSEILVDSPLDVVASACAAHGLVCESDGAAVLTFAGQGIRAVVSYDPASAEERYREAEGVTLVFDSYEVSDGEKEAEVIISFMPKSPFEAVRSACEGHGMAFSSDGAAVLEFSGLGVRAVVSADPAADEEIFGERGGTTIVFDASEVSDGEKEAEVIISFISSEDGNPEEEE